MEHVPLPVPLTLKSLESRPLTDSLKTTSNVSGSALVMPSLLLEPMSLAACRVIVAVGRCSSPAAKSLNEVNPDPVTLVKLDVDPPAGADQVAPLYLRTARAAVFGLPTRSPAAKLKVAS